MKRILTVGVYDLLHVGHVELFRRAREMGDYLIVAVQDDCSIQQYKPGVTTVYSTTDRVHLVRSIRYVDEVVIYRDVDIIVKQVDFDVFVTGPDQAHEGFMRAISWCRANGKETVVLPRTDGISSSHIRNIIRQH